MENKDIATAVLKVLAAVIIVRVSIITAGKLIVVASNGLEKMKFKKQIKKGLEEGRIVEIDGKYYEVA